MQQCQSLICLCWTWKESLQRVATCSVSDSAHWHLQMIGSSVGQSSAQEWRGVRRLEGGVTGSKETYWLLKWPTAIIFYSSTFFIKAREGLHILFFPSFLSFQRFWSCLWEKKVHLRYQYTMKKHFCWFSFCCFFLSLKMHKCNTETKKYQNRSS